jgi:predicted MFS family arabinose efflux permease
LRQKATLVVLLVAVTSLSQFYRVSNSVIAPELTRELGLSVQQLGWAGGAFFAALFVAQVPIGIWFDRYGARRTVAALSLFAVIGAILLARAESAAALIAARAMIGLGCAASFMAVVFLCARWFAPMRLTAALSWVFAASNLGTLAAATPLAWIAGAIGWRQAFLGVAGITLIVAIAFATLVRDRPPDALAGPGRGESLGEILRGLGEVLRTPGLWPILALHSVAYASMLTVLGVWGGPYLHDVHGLQGVARGHVLFAMGFAQILGILAYGPLDRLVGARKPVIVAGAAATACVLLLLGLVPRLPLSVVVCLLVLFCLLAAYPVVIVAQGRSLFPDRLAGRGVTTVNMAQLLGLVVLPTFTGWVLALLGEGGQPVPENAYRAVFLVLAGCLAAGLAAYAGATKNAPRPQPPAG